MPFDDSGKRAWSRVPIVRVAIPTVASFIAALCLAGDLQQVGYVRSSILDSDEGRIQLMDGSVWEAAYSSFLLVASDVVVVLTGTGSEGVMYADGTEVPVSLVTGRPILERGYLTEVIKELGDGAILITTDGTTWEVPQYDRYDSGWWLPPYTVLISKDQMYMTNLEKGKRIWVQRVER